MRWHSLRMLRWGTRVRTKLLPPYFLGPLYSMTSASTLQKFRKPPVFVQSHGLQWRERWALVIKRR